MLKFDNPTYEQLVSREWLVTNGIGGYASGTIGGVNTRRYHALLIAPLDPPVERRVFVTKVEECVFMGRDTCISLSTNRYPGAIHPEGYQYVRYFDRSPFPRMNFQVGTQEISKTIFMPHGSNTSVIEYKNSGNVPLELTLTPFFADRDYHALFRESAHYDYFFEQSGNTLKIHPHHGAAPLFFKFTKGSFAENRYWLKNIEYEREQGRGLDFQEDNYALGQVKVSLAPQESTFLVFTLEEELLQYQPEVLKAAEIERLNVLKKDKSLSTFIQDLLVAGDQFIIRRQRSDTFSIIAGYPWFTDWARDAMIALRGLGIAAGRQQVSKSILQTFIQHLKHGLLPNRFPDSADDELEYNTVDATLWMFVALYEYYLKFGGRQFIEAIFAQLTTVVEAHLAGTSYNIHVTEEGFLYAGEGDSQLTWMDARVGDYVVTPRHGCPVEIQALWYNTLKIYTFFAGEIGKKDTTGFLDKCSSLADKLRINFEQYFLNEQGYLNDVVVPHVSKDQTLRPNQVYVISLPFRLLTEEEEKTVIRIIRERLYTPFGLRTLPVDDPNFKPVYGGNQWERDTAYHQGTVWPFLLGDYYRAYLKVNHYSAEAKLAVLEGFRKIEEHFYEKDCIHGISEVFDGLEPTDGRGAIHQAWSVGAMLQVLFDKEFIHKK